MNEREWGDRLGRDVDVLLRGGDPAMPATAPPEYGEMLMLARQLAGADLSTRTAIRQPLRRRLLADANRQAMAPARRWDVRELPWKRAALLVPLAIVAFLMVSLLMPMLQRAWPLGGSGSLGALALTASPTLAEQMLDPGPRLVATPHLGAPAGSAPVPAPTAGTAVPVASAALPPTGTHPVVRTATGMPTGLPPTSNLR